MSSDEIWTDPLVGAGVWILVGEAVFFSLIGEVSWDLDADLSNGSELCWSFISWSVVVVGSINPLRFPAVKRPIIRVPAMDVWITGIWSANSDSKWL